MLKGLFNPELLLSPLITREAVLSSKIEGTQASLSDVLKFEAGEPPKDESRELDIREILNYRKALTAAETELKSRPFNLNLLKKLQGVVSNKGTPRLVTKWVEQGILILYQCFQFLLLTATLAMLTATMPPLTSGQRCSGLAISDRLRHIPARRCSGI